MPKKKTKNLYWTKETEQAVIDYNNTDDTLLKNQIFSTHLYKPLSKKEINEEFSIDKLLQTTFFTF